MTTESPEAAAFRARLESWRARPPEGQEAHFAANHPDDVRARLARVTACPDRGGVLPIAMQPQGCARCGELSECRAGKGKTPGRVTLRECLECRED